MLPLRANGLQLGRAKGSRNFVLSQPVSEMSAFFGQLPVLLSSVKEKHKMASHLAFLSSSAVNIDTN